MRHYLYWWLAYLHNSTIWGPSHTAVKQSNPNGFSHLGDKGVCARFLHYMGQLILQGKFFYEQRCVQLNYIFKWFLHLCSGILMIITISLHYILKCVLVLLPNVLLYDSLWCWTLGKSWSAAWEMCVVLILMCMMCSLLDTYYVFCVASSIEEGIIDVSTFPSHYHVHV